LCSEDDGYLFEKSITAWRCTGQPYPQVDGHHKLARMRVVKDMMKENYGRPFFVCSDKKNPCSFWVWGDVLPTTKPTCHHGFQCAFRKVKKEGINKDRMFFCCPNGKEDSCRFFEWAPDEPDFGSFCGVNYMPSLHDSYLATDSINDFANKLNL
jgi:hypothetical protein